MNPEAIWDALLDALDDLRDWPTHEETRARVVEYLNSLSQWIAQGGFPPNPFPQDDDDDDEGGVLV
jgi:hypothetical protein